jgi:hypothetical protein
MIDRLNTRAQRFALAAMLVALGLAANATTSRAQQCVPVENCLIAETAVVDATVEEPASSVKTHTGPVLLDWQAFEVTNGGMTLRIEWRSDFNKSVSGEYDYCNYDYKMENRSDRPIRVAWKMVDNDGPYQQGHTLGVGKSYVRNWTENVSGCSSDFRRKFKYIRISGR